MWDDRAMVSLRQGTNCCLAGDRQGGDNVVSRRRDLVSAEVDDHAGSTVRLRTVSAVIGEGIGFSWVICLDQLDVVVAGDEVEEGGIKRSMNHEKLPRQNRESTHLIPARSPCVILSPRASSKSQLRISTASSTVKVDQTLSRW
jgi:hypothetical protein